MDEENQGFSIPANKNMFDEGDVGIEITPMPQSDFFMAFANEAGDKAVILTPIEYVGDEILERHGRSELEGYANGLMDGEPDDMGLQIGDIFEGENAQVDAEAEAARLDEEYNPGEGASDEDLIAAIDGAKADTTVSEENALAEAEGGGEVPFPLSGPLGVEEGVGETEPGIGEEDMGEEPVGVEGEPMLDQLKKRAT